jgi:hypothetical protein
MSINKKIKNQFVLAMIFLMLLFQGAQSPQEKTGTENQDEKLFKMSLEELLKVKVNRENITRWPYAKTCSFILLKIISLDENLKRFGEPIKIGVVSDKIFRQLKALEEKIKIKGKHFKTEKINSLKTVAGCKIIYITKEMARNRFNEIEKLVEDDCFIFCEDEESILFGHGAVLLKVVDKFTHVVVNLDNVRRQGASFPEEELDLVLTVRSGR